MHGGNPGKIIYIDKCTYKAEFTSTVYSIDHLTSDVNELQFTGSGYCSLPGSVRTNPILISTRAFKITATHNKAQEGHWIV